MRIFIVLLVLAFSAVMLFVGQYLSI